MARFISLNLVNEEGTPHPWPGTPTQHEIGTQISARAVWIGVSADGNTNQVYPLTTPPATILASWPRLFQGVQLNTLVEGDDSPAAVEAGEFVYYVSLEQFNRLEAACCVAIPNVESPVCEVSFDWVHLTGAGNMTILVDGEEVVSSGAGNGSFTAPEGAQINVIVEGGTSTNSVTVEDDVDGELYTSNNGSGEFGEDYTFTAICGRAYTITGQTTPGE
jgi:hypothetical protein